MSAKKKSEPTAYGKLMKRMRTEPKAGDPVRSRRAATTRGKCGAKRKESRGGGRCQLTAGHGTTHLGFGKCRYHGGNLPTHNAHAASQRAILMGAELEINPLDALIWCIKLTAGEVEFCNQQLHILEEADWIENTIVGKQLHLWAKERQKAVDRLAKFSKDALALGIAERAVRLAEQYGHTLATYTKGLIDDLTPYLSEEGVKAMPLIVRKHLALLEGASPVTQYDRKHLPEIPARVKGAV